MSRPLRLLLIEDSDDDATLLLEELRRGGFSVESTRVESAEQLRGALPDNDFDIAISDYLLPQFSAPAALEIIKSTGRDIPFIVVSGAVTERMIIDAMRTGARDYVMKDNLTRLPLAVTRELEELAERRRRRGFDEQLRHAQRLESLGVLAGGIAHDFNNLLMGVLGNTTMALESLPGDSSIRELLERVILAAEQLAHLTGQLLAYAGKGRFVVEPLDLSRVIQEGLPLLKVSVPKNIEVRLELQTGLPLVEADRGQIRQLLINLVTNAAESIDSGRPGTITVKTGVQDLSDDELASAVFSDGVNPGRYVCLEVQDTGSGMDEKTRARIFDPFFTTKFTGRGLGLPAVLGIVRGHRGTLRVSSGRGVGSVFTVLLPVSGRQPLTTRPDSQLNRVTLSGRVLVVDDEETVRKTSSAMIEHLGMNVLTAANGREGVELFSRHADGISVVLLDLTMPFMGGHEALAGIRAINPAVPIILTSGFAELQAMAQFESGGVTAFLQKPFTVAKLLSTIQAALERKETESS